MNLQNHFITSWNESFTNEGDKNTSLSVMQQLPSPPYLECLKAENFDSVEHQQENLKFELNKAQDKLNKMQFEVTQQMFLVKYLTDTKERLKLVAELLSSSAVGVPKSSISSIKSEDENVSEIESFNKIDTKNINDSNDSNSSFPYNHNAMQLVENGGKGVDIGQSTDLMIKKIKINPLTGSCSIQDVAPSCKAQSTAINETNHENMKPMEVEAALPCSSTSSLYPLPSNNVEKDSSVKQKIVITPRNKRFCGKTTVTEFHCDECERYFSSNITLNQHMMMHTGEKPFVCHICARRFRQRAQLTTHVRVHTDQRPYGCSVCGKRFRQQSHVIQHIKVHTNEKPYKCGKCGKSFRQKAARDKHVDRQCRSRRTPKPLDEGETLWYGPTNMVDDAEKLGESYSVVGGVTGAALRFNNPVNLGVVNTAIVNNPSAYSMENTTLELNSTNNSATLNGIYSSSIVNTSYTTGNNATLNLIPSDIDEDFGTYSYIDDGDSVDFENSILKMQNDISTIKNEYS